MDRPANRRRTEPTPDPTPAELVSDESSRFWLHDSVLGTAFERVATIFEAPESERLPEQTPPTAPEPRAVPAPFARILEGVASLFEAPLEIGPLQPLEDPESDLPNEPGLAALESSSFFAPEPEPPLGTSPEAEPGEALLLGPIIDLRARRPESPPITASPAAPGSPNTSYVVDRSVMLPPAQREERGTFANLLGFGEEEVYYGPTEAPIETRQNPQSDPALPKTEAMTGAAALDQAWAELPGLADVTAPDINDTGTLIGRLWDATSDQPILGHVDIPEPTLPSPNLLTDKRWRWSMLAALTAAVLLVFAAGNALGQRPIEAALEREIAYVAANSRLADSLEPIEYAIGRIADPDVDPLDIPTVVTDLDVFDGIAREATEVAADPLPRPAFLGSSTEIDRLETPQAWLRQSAAQASSLEQRLGDGLTYRITITRAFQLPGLPVAAGDEAVADLASRLSVVLASSRAIVDELPEDPFFSTHTERAHRLLDELTDTHVDYLDALRLDDPARAGTERRAMVAAIDQFSGSISEPLGALEAWSKQQLASLTDLVERIDSALG